MKVLLATGNTQIDEFIQTAGVNDSLEVERCFSKDDIERYIKKFQPDVLILTEMFDSENITAPIDIVKFVRQISNTRIIYLSRKRSEGDPYLRELINLGVYDLFINPKIDPNELYSHILNPAKWGDVSYLLESTNNEIQEEPKEPKVVYKETPAKIIEKIVEKPVIKEKIKKEVVEKEVIKEVYKMPEGIKKTVAIFSPESTGKTFIAWNLAYELSSRKHKVTLVDMDYSHGLSYYVDSANINNQDPILKTIESPDEDASIEINDYFRMYTTDKEQTGLGVMKEEFLSFYNYVRDMSDIVIFDLGRDYNDEIIKLVLSLVDEIYAIVTQESKSIYRLENAFKKMPTNKISTNKFSLIINKYTKIKGVDIRDIEEYFEEIEQGGKKITVNFKRVFTIADNFKEVAEGQTDHRPVKDELLANSIKEIADFTYGTGNYQSKKGILSRLKLTK